MSIVTKFNDNNLQMNFLTENDIRRECPVVFAKQPTNEKVSDKYSLAKTIDVIRDLEKLDWRCVSAKQKNNTIRSGRYSYHALFFQNPEFQTNEGFPRIMLTNSHDGCNSFRFGCAFYRLVCSNGLIIADNSFADLKIRHINYDFNALQTLISTIVESLPEKLALIDTMKNIILTAEQMEKIAIESYLVRQPNENSDNLPMSLVYALTNPIRETEKEPTLWNVYNTIQERIIKGMGRIEVKDKIRKMRPIKSIANNIDINSKLWQIAQTFINK